MCPGKNIPEGGSNQNTGKRNSTCSAEEMCSKHPLFIVLSMSICRRSLKLLDYVMLTEQGNDVYCAQRATVSDKAGGLPCKWDGGRDGGEGLWGTLKPKGGQVKSSVLL